MLLMKQETILKQYKLRFFIRDVISPYLESKRVSILIILISTILELKGIVLNPIAVLERLIVVHIELSRNRFREVTLILKSKMFRELHKS